MSDGTRTLTLTVAGETAEEFERLAREEGLTSTELLRALVDAYRMRAAKARFRQAQAFGARRAREMGLQTEDDVVRLVHEVREESREQSRE